MQKLLKNHFRWVITGLVFFITLVNFVDRSAISFVINPLKEEFHFNDTQFGMILSAFGVGYVLLTALGGWLVDVWGARIAWCFAAVLWSICFGLLGFASSLGGFIGLRFLLGVTEGPHFPAMSHTINRWLPPAERARAFSLGLVAIPLSSVVGAPLTSYLVNDFGWRNMFFIISGSGILWALAWFWLFRDHPKDSTYMSASEKEMLAKTCAENGKHAQEKIDWHFLLTHPTLLANNIAYFAFGYMLFFATLWLPGYFLAQHGLNLKSVGWYLTIPWLVGAIFLKGGGFLSDWLYKKTGNMRLSRSHIIWSSQLLAAICFVILSFTHSLGLSILFLSLGLGFGLMPQPAFFSINVDVAKQYSASSQGITSSCLSLAGILAPVLTGWLIDLTQNFQGAFLLLAAFTGLAVVTVIFFHHPDKEYVRTPSRWKRPTEAAEG
jgi:sugar phosphate permease